MAARHQLQHPARAGRNAHAAARAAGHVHTHHAVLDLHGVEGADLHAVTEAHAGPVAGIGAAAQHGRRRAGGHALILVAQGHIAGQLVTAPQREQGLRLGHGLAGQLAHGDGRIGTARAAFVGRDVGIGDHGRGVPFAAGKAATTAVGPGQDLQHGLHPRVFLDVEDARGDGQQDGGHEPQSEQGDDGNENHICLSLPPSGSQKPVVRVIAPCP